MSRAKITLIGIYQYLLESDDDLFKDLDLPEEIDAETVKNTILMNNAEFETLYSNPYFMQNMVGIWSQKWKASFKRWYDALIASKYNPVENYDRYEEWTDTGKSSGTDKSSGKTENKTSAYNASSYQPEALTESGTEGTTSAESDNTHIGHIHGNIGVTTSAQMISGDVELYKNYNIYDMIAECFKTELLIMTY